MCVFFFLFRYLVLVLRYFSWRRRPFFKIIRFQLLLTFLFIIKFLIIIRIKLLKRLILKPTNSLLNDWHLNAATHMFLIQFFAISLFIGKCLVVKSYHLLIYLQNFILLFVFISYLILSGHFLHISFYTGLLLMVERFHTI